MDKFLINKKKPLKVTLTKYKMKCIRHVKEKFASLVYTVKII